jgi:hypothetical protein
MTTIRSLSFDLLYIIQDYAFGLEYKIKPIFKPYVYPPSMLGNPLVIGYAKERLGSYNESAENEEEI